MAATAASTGSDTHSASPVSSPDQLDRNLKVIDSYGWIGLWTVLATIVAGLVWSVVSTVPVKVTGTGILLQSGGVSEVTAGASGQIAEIKVVVGDRVKAGQVVATLSQPTLESKLLDARANVRDLQAIEVELKKFHDAAIDLVNRTSDLQRANLTQRRDALAQLLASQKQRLDGVQELYKKGIVPRQVVLDAQTAYDSTKNDLASAGVQQSQVSSSILSEEVSRQKDLMQNQMQLGQATREVAALESELQGTSQIVATDAGTVVEIDADAGQTAGPQTPVVRILPDANRSGELRAYVFYPPRDGKKVKVGMAVQVAPSTVQREEWGYINGRVLAISEIPSTTAGMQRLLKNETLVKQLSADGAPFEATIELIRDPATRSGFQWSSAKGPPISVGYGTLADADVVTSRRRVISIVFPLIDQIF